MPRRKRRRPAFRAAEFSLAQNVAWAERRDGPPDDFKDSSDMSLSPIITTLQLTSLTCRPAAVHPLGQAGRAPEPLRSQKSRSGGSGARVRSVVLPFSPSAGQAG